MELKGKLIIIDSGDKLVLTSEDKSTIVTSISKIYKDTEANAQRLVKCWNEYDSLKAKADCCGAFEAIAHRLSKANDELVEALKRYGNHLNDCKLTEEAKLNLINACSCSEVYCDCGFKQILAKAERS